MEVKLIAYTPGPEGVVAAAARGCYSARPASQLLDTSIPAAHESCYEHAVFTFSVEGVSRVLSHQLVRHRLASYSQQSMRYVSVDKLYDNDHRHLDKDIVIPETMMAIMKDEFEMSDTQKDERLKNLFITYLDGLDRLVAGLKDYQVPGEDIRYLLPLGTRTNLVMTMNYRELHHFCGLRMCRRAQWEIRELAERISAIVAGECPQLYYSMPLVAQCEQLGYCPEHKSCGKHLTRDELESLARLKEYHKETLDKLKEDD